MPNPHHARIAGHRGRGRSRPGNPWPENTLPSFLAAAAEGAELVELDVQHTADGRLVVIHDDTVDRTTDGRGCVQGLSFEALRRLDAGRGAPSAPGARIPTLAEVVASVPVGLNVEIKLHRDTRCPPQDRRRLAVGVRAALCAVPPGRAAIVSSFDLEVLRALRRLDAGIALGYLTDRPDGIRVAIGEGMAAAHLSDALVTAERVHLLHEAGLSVHVWTVNRPERARALFSLGVDMLITDEPGRMRRVRDES